ncbi:MAG: hypothetical protein WCJ19_00005, partial [bacterium]
MNILITTHHLTYIAGSELNILDLAITFIKLGFDVTVATFLYDYPLKEHFEINNIKVVNLLTDNTELLNKNYNLIWSQHAPTLDFVIFRLNISADKVVFSSLSPFEPLETAPVYANLLSICLANSEETKEQLIDEGIEKQHISVFPNSVTDDYFNNKYVYKEQPTHYAVISNHMPREILDLELELKKESIKINYYGMEKESVFVTPDFLLKYDGIISIGRSVQYGLSMGIPTYCYDHFGGIGWINSNNLEQAKKYNFSGRDCNRKISAKKITHELINERPNKHELERLKEYSLLYFSLTNNIKAILTILESSNKVDFKKIKAVSLKRHNEYYTRILLQNKIDKDDLLGIIATLNSYVTNNEKEIEQFKNKHNVQPLNPIEYIKPLSFKDLIQNKPNPVQ